MYLMTLSEIIIVGLVGVLVGLTIANIINFAFKRKKKNEK